jgi:hypothetical protein
MDKILVSSVACILFSIIVFLNPVKEYNQQPPAGAVAKKLNSSDNELAI